MNKSFDSMVAKRELSTLPVPRQATGRDLSQLHPNSKIINCLHKNSLQDVLTSLFGVLSALFRRGSHQNAVSISCLSHPSYMFSTSQHLACWCSRNATDSLSVCICFESRVVHRVLEVVFVSLLGFDM